MGWGRKGLSQRPTTNPAAAPSKRVAKQAKPKQWNQSGTENGTTKREEKLKSGPATDSKNATHSPGTYDGNQNGTETEAETEPKRKTENGIERGAENGAENGTTN